MKKLFLFIVTIYTFINSYAQIDFKNQIAIQTGVIYNSIGGFPFNAKKDIGYSNSINLIYGFQYNKKMTEKIWINSGLTFASLNYQLLSQKDMLFIHIENKINTKLIQLPLRVLFVFSKWTYLKAGPIIDFQLNKKSNTNIDNQTGLGFNLAFGFNYKISKNVFFNFEPDFSLTSLLPFYFEKYQDHFFMKGLNFNLGYSF